MPEVLLIDEAWTRADPKAIKAAGYVGVIGYVSHDASKCMTKARAKALHAEGLVVGLVFEDTATRALQGAAAGRQDLAFMAAHADAIGYPTACDRFYACDTDASGEQAAPYFDVVAGPREGPYGDLKVCDDVHRKHPGAPLWETEAWDGTAVSDIATLYQRVGKSRPKIAGVAHNSYDENVVLKQLNLWGAKGVVALDAPKPPKPASKQTPLNRVTRALIRKTTRLLERIVRRLAKRRRPTNPAGLGALASLATLCTEFLAEYERIKGLK